MDNRSTFLLQVLEKLASPLVAAISEVSVRQMMIPDPTKPGAMRPEAEQVASLLTKSTQMSIGLSNLVDMRLPDNEADSLRLALTSLSSPLMANIYRLAGRTPTEAEIERVTAAMSAVISYSENFTPAGDATVRMTGLEADFMPSDPAQIRILYMSAILPAVNSVMAYSFGLPEKKLVQDVADRLVHEAKTLRLRAFPDMNEREGAKSDLALLRMAALIYSQCHFAEMAKLMATEDQVRQGLAPTMTTLWQAFGLRMQMLEVLADALVPGGTAKRSGSGTSGGGHNPAPLQETSPPTAADQGSTPNGPQGNPMAFFARKNSSS
ncbi:MAG: hypothetical protein KBF91_00035 [Alphaproteobacteria bacterium]|jgi:hypothetical protein|nr:hypothetical protein [Alphaproteobacteria bacterium]